MALTAICDGSQCPFSQRFTVAKLTPSFSANSDWLRFRRERISLIWFELFTGLTPLNITFDFHYGNTCACGNTIFTNEEMISASGEINEIADMIAMGYHEMAAYHLKF